MARIPSFKEGGIVDNDIVHLCENQMVRVSGDWGNIVKTLRKIEKSFEKLGKIQKLGKAEKRL